MPYAFLVLLLRQFLLCLLHPLHHGPVGRADEGAGAALEAVHQAEGFCVLIMALRDTQKVPTTSPCSGRRQTPLPPVSVGPPASSISWENCVPIRTRKLPGDFT